MAISPWSRLPAYVLEELMDEYLCEECAHNPIFVGWFLSLSSTGCESMSAMLLCEECARNVDSGVWLQPLSEVQP